MPLQLRAPSKAFDNALHGKLSHIWISDSLLHETFNRFVSSRGLQCKRFGCNVPGPLEARRRLAKRRLNSLATDPGGVVLLEPVVTSGWFGGIWARSANEPDWRWEPPGLKQGRPEKPFPGTTSALLSFWVVADASYSATILAGCQTSCTFATHLQ